MDFERTLKCSRFLQTTFLIKNTAESQQGHHYITIGTVLEKLFFQSKNKYQGYSSRSG